MDEKVMALLKGNAQEERTVCSVLRDTDIVVKHGYTKFVLLDKESDFVYKFQRKDNVKYNYCAREAKVYQNAIKWGIAFLFAPTVKVGYIEEDFPYYKQVKVSEFGYWRDGDRSYRHPTLEKKVRTILQEFNSRSRYGGCPREWCGYVLKAYGEKTLLKLLFFLEVNKINDLRDENIGFLDGKPILVDYSGYHGAGQGHRF